MLSVTESRLYMDGAHFTHGEEDMGLLGDLNLQLMTGIDSK